MPTETREGIIQPLDESMFPLVQWRLRDLSRPEAPVVALAGDGAFLMTGLELLTAGQD